MRIDVLTLFPAMFQGPMTESMLWKARDHHLLDLRLHDIRDFTTDKHRKADDIPYGGGGGMIMKAEPVVSGVEMVLQDALPGTPVILMTPQGRVFSHRIAKELAVYDRLVFVCGRYEGLDERVRQLVVTDEISIGDYVLTGGELPAMVIIDAVIRHIPGVLGACWAAEEDSHADGILEGPHYTRPPVYRGLEVPAVLQQGDHGKIQQWRREQGLRRTWHNRPDLLLKAHLTEDEKYLLADFANGNLQDGSLVH
ncbi:MAG TPA: tRNA (guanosine(37)-N1)-methyltransferase TrmD [Phototrophicaceae bacterium]|nr:tRNA (guanosine(37)-N1)-methyltransferase TrmD [Phototrophicaceae bacterium]